MTPGLCRVRRLLAAICLAASVGYAETVWFVNGGSSTVAVPATGPSTLAPGTYAGSVDGRAIAYDVFASVRYLGIDQPAFSSSPVDLSETPATLRLDLTAAQGVVTVRTRTCDYRVGGGQLELRAFDKARTIPLPGEPRVVFHGAHLAVIELGIGVDAVRLDIYASGVARVSNVKRLDLGVPKGVSAVESRRDNFGIAGTPAGKPLQFPEDWWRISDPGTLGVVVLPAPGATLLGEASAVSCRSGDIYLAPATSDAEARSLRFATHEPLVLSPRQNAFVGEALIGKSRVAVEALDRNADGKPDFTHDLWAFGGIDKGARRVLVAFSSDPQLHASFYAAAAKTLAESQVAETLTDGAAPAGALKPLLVIDDFNGNKRLFHGSLLVGGYLGGDRMANKPNDWVTNWDLNGDDDADVFEAGAGYLFDFLGQLTSIHGVNIDPVGASISMRKQAGYEMQFAGSMFKKSDDAGRTYQGARLPFEEHFFISAKPGDFPKVFPNGATLFYYTVDGHVGRMTMGRFGGNDPVRSWAIEMKPRYAVDASESWNVLQWQDASGHALKLLSPSLPREWNGDPVGPDAFLRGWSDVVTHAEKLEGLQVCFAPPGSPNGASEGMYGGALSSAERIEYDPSGASFTLYYSPLMGGLHLKNAKVGSYAIPSGTPDFWLDVNRYYHREAHQGADRFVGTEPSIRWMRGQEIKRLEGPVFLSYHARSNANYFDTYLYDLDNDGVYERRLAFEPKSSVLTLSDDRFVTAWAEPIRFDEVKYLPENYDKVGELYRRGFRQAPLVAKAQIGSGGIPVITESEPVFRERQPGFFVSLDKSWQTRVSVDRVHSIPGASWRDFGVNGLSRIGTMFVSEGLVQDELTVPWSEQSLANVDVLIVASLARVPDDTELAALRAWIERGGRVILACPEDAAQRIRFNAIGQQLGFALSETLLDRRTAPYRIASLGPINDPKNRAAPERRPGPWNAVEHYADPQSLGLLKDLRAISFVGYAIEKLDAPLKPLLACDGQTIIASGTLGRGTVVISGVNLWTNKYIWHHEFYENGTQNAELVQRLVGAVTWDLPLAAVRSIDVTPARNTLHLTGRGGLVRYSRRYEPRASGLAHIESFNSNNIPVAEPTEPAQVLVNGKPVEVREVGVLSEVSVPAGDVTIEITYRTPAASEAKK